MIVLFVAALHLVGAAALLHPQHQASSARASSAPPFPYGFALGSSTARVPALVTLFNIMVSVPSHQVSAKLATRVAPPSRSARESPWPVLLLLWPLVARAGSWVALFLPHGLAWPFLLLCIVTLT